MREWKREAETARAAVKSAELQLENAMKEHSATQAALIQVLTLASFKCNAIIAHLLELKCQTLRNVCKHAALHEVLDRLVHHHTLVFAHTSNDDMKTDL